jgi:arylsulfatase A-like enzyme
MMDTLSAKHIGVYGYDRDTMPRTTAFFKDGVIFEDATASSPWTLPSFTGMYFSDLATNITYADLDGGRKNIQSELRENGVIIRAVVPSAGNFLIDAITRPFAKDEITTPGEGQRPFTLARDGLKELVASGKRFFYSIHSFEVHDPYNPGDEYDEIFGNADEYPVVTMRDLLIENSKPEIDMERTKIFELRYDQNLLKIDARIAEFLESIPKETLKNTAVILAADHGEAFGEHGKVWHGNGVFQEVLHVPLMMRVPGIRAKRIVEPVSLLDMAPTVLSMMNVNVPSEFTGKNLVPLIASQPFRERTIPFVQGMPYFLKEVTPDMKPAVSLQATGAEHSTAPIIEPTMYGVRQGKQKMFVMLNHSAQTRNHWFNLETDPGETVNLWPESPDAVPKNLKGALDALASALKLP